MAKNWFLVLLIIFQQSITLQATIKLVTSDNVEYVMQEDVAKKFRTIAAVLGDVSSVGVETYSIPLPMVASAQFGVIESFLNNKLVLADICEDASVEKMRQLIEVISAADYLGFSEIDLLCTKIADFFYSNNILRFASELQPNDVQYFLRIMDGLKRRQGFRPILQKRFSKKDDSGVIALRWLLPTVFAYVRSDGILRKCCTEDKQEMSCFKLSGYDNNQKYHSPVWALDRKELVLQNNSEIAVWDLETGLLKAKLDFDRARELVGKTQPDSLKPEDSTLAWCKESELYLWKRLESGEFSDQVFGFRLSSPANVIASSPDLVKSVIKGREEVKVLGPATGYIISKNDLQLSKYHNADTHFCDGIAWHPNSNTVAIGFVDGRSVGVVLCDAVSKNLSDKIYFNEFGDISSLDWSPDASKLIVSKDRVGNSAQGLFLCQKSNDDVQSQMRYFISQVSFRCKHGELSSPGVGPYMEKFVFSPDGKHLASWREDEKKISVWGDFINKKPVHEIYEILTKHILAWRCAHLRLPLDASGDEINNFLADVRESKS